MKNRKTKLKTIYRCSTTGVILLTVDGYLIEHKLDAKIDISIGTKSNFVKYEVVDVLDVSIDATSPIETVVVKEYSVYNSIIHNNIFGDFN